MTDKEILIKKYDLVVSDIYSQIKSFQIENIIRLANSDVEPLILKGMLKVLADTDKWETDFINERKRS